MWRGLLNAYYQVKGKSGIKINDIGVKERLFL
jgi:hypothetical protein